MPPASSARSFPALPPAPPGSCRLPFSDISEARGGFILYPGGQRLDDPASVVALPGNTPGTIGVNPGLTFDVATGTWVPVPLQWLAPSGITYAYMSAGGGIRAVTVSDGQSGEVAGGGWNLIGTLDDGVFATKPGTPGVWFIPFGQDPYQWVDHGGWQRYYGNALWGVDSSERLVRHELGNGVETTWGSVLSVSQISGFDAAGEPVVYTGGQQAIHHADGSTTTVWPGTNGLTSSGYVFGDSYGIWFEVDGSSGLVGAPGSGIYLWTQSGGASLVTREPVHPMGPCI